ncbi:MAG TPA: phage Gp37/Gp68 family protein [Longimicrobium sp.]
MGDRSAIEWTDATWNPVTGCTKVSAGCDNCYAHTLAHTRLAEVYLRELPVVRSEKNIADPFSVRIWPDRLSEPGKWKNPRMVFVNSMSDLFHVDVPETFVRDIFTVMLKVKRHTYQVLTKRPSRAARFFIRNRDLFSTGEIPRHIWMGTSVENQNAVYRIDQIQKVPATVRFLSCEPLLGPLQLDLAGIDWVIVGGESGIGYRPMNPEWVLGIKEQCEAAGVAFFFKQWGGRTPKAGGRMLNGRTWDEMPVRDETPDLLAFA